MKYNNVEEIKKAFVLDGWNENITFSVLSMDEAITEGGEAIIEKMKLGNIFFKMNQTGNIFNNKGRVVIFNIKASL